MISSLACLHVMCSFLESGHEEMDFSHFPMINIAISIITVIIIIIHVPLAIIISNHGGDICVWCG